MRAFEPKIDAERFTEEIRKRKINYLVHFTPTVNFLGMCEQRHVLSRQEIRDLQIDAPDLAMEDYIEFNDTSRLDNYRGHINTSIMFPNHYLFARFRQKRDLAYLHWCVIIITAKYIYERGTLFSISNAASSAARAKHPISGKYDTFSGMFADVVAFETFNGSRSNNRHGLKTCYPTDTQAEVLVEIPIPLSDVQEVCFKDQEELSITTAALRTQGVDSGLKYTVNPAMFGNNRE